MLLLIVCLPMLSGILCAACKKLRTVLPILIPAVCLAFCACMTIAGRNPRFTVSGVCALGLSFSLDGFRGLYASVASFMWLMTGLFSHQYFRDHHERGRYWLATLITFGATLGVLLSDDLYTTFVFFEIMSVTSYVWVAQEEDRAALRAAGTYLAVAMIGGMTTLMGLFMLYRGCGSLAFEVIRNAEIADKELVAWLILTGFAAKAGLFPLHVWLPKAHPVAPAPASALLSGMLTKAGIFGMIIICLRLMPGCAAFGLPLLILALVTMFAGAVMALFSVNLKRTLACSSMSQIGFITFGLASAVLLGEEGTLSAMGTVLHMLNHSLIKLCLFLCAGTVHMNLHELNLNDIRGFGRGKPVLRIAFLAGALSIAGVPFLGSGYLSKSMLHEGFLEYIAVIAANGGNVLPWKIMEYVFLFSGGLTFCYMLRLYVCLFRRKPSDTVKKFETKKKPALTALSSVVLLLCALPFPLLGLFPGLLAEPVGVSCMPFFCQKAPAHTIAWFSGENLLGALESIGLGLSVYVLCASTWLEREGVYPDRWPRWLDLENSVYRPVISFGVRITDAVVRFVASIPDGNLVMKVIPSCVSAVIRWISFIPDSAAVLKFFPACVTALTRFFSELPERIALLVKRLFRPAKPRQHAEGVSASADITERFLNFNARVLNRTLLRRRPVNSVDEETVETWQRGLTGGFFKILRSVSFGLLLLCIGLCLTCLYLLRH